MKVIAPLEKELLTCRDTPRLIEIIEQLILEYEVNNITKGIAYGIQLYNIGEATHNKRVMSNAAYELGIIYQHDLHDFVTALDWQLRALQFATEVKDSAKITNASYMLAYINASIGDSVRADNYLKHTISIAEQSNDYAMLVSANIGLGDMTKSRQKKMAFYQKALAASEKVSEDTIQAGHLYITLGDLFWSNEKSKANKWYEKCYQLLLPYSGRDKDPSALEMIALAAVRTKRYDESIKFANLNLYGSSKENGSTYFIERALKTLAEAYHGNGYDSLAFWTAMRYNELRDSLNEKRMNEQVQTRVLNSQSELELNKKRQELELLQTKAIYETTITYIAFISTIILAALAYYLFHMRQRENLQNQKLTQANQTKDKLLSIISHDVRSPIQALQNIIKLFEQDIATKEDVQTVTTQVNASIQNMAQNLDNLFFWAQNQQRELVAYPELMDGRKLLHAVIDQSQHAIDRKEILLDLSLLPQILLFADPMHVRLVLNNILINAIKFTPQGGHIKISTQYKNTEPSMLQVSIFNTGEPIREEDLPKIFDPGIRYTRVGTRNEPGSGLGLSLSRDLIHLNQGQMNIAAVSNVGTQVDLFLPSKKP